MRPYGLEYEKIDRPDVVDIQEQARKSCVGKLAGDQHGYIRSSKRKKQIRQYWKGRARMRAHNEIHNELKTMD